MKLHFKTFTYVLSDKIQQLYTLCHDLLYLGMDGSPVYTNDLSRLNRDVYRLCDELYDSGLRGATPEEEGFLCLSLLKGYLASYCDYGNKQTRIQAVLQRIRAVLPQLPASLLRVRLLVWTYSETFDDSLAREAHALMEAWGDGATWTAEQKEIQEELKNFEESREEWEEWEEEGESREIKK